MSSSHETASGGARPKEAREGGIIYSTETETEFRRRVEWAVAEVDCALSQGLKAYPDGLPPLHYARMTHQRPTIAGTLFHENFGLLVPLARRLETCRAQAEAALVQQELGGLLLDAYDREQLIRRAIGILPNTEHDRFQEILGTDGLSPTRMSASPERLMAGIATIAEHLTPATGLAYGMLLVAGARSNEQLLAYASKIDRLFDRVTATPNVIQAAESLHGADPAAVAANGANYGFRSQFGVLSAVREELWRCKPERASTPFLLTQVLDGYLSNQSGVGNSLGLAVIDAIIIGKLGFEVKFRIEADVLYLEILVDHQSVYWDVAHPSDLSYIPIAAGRPLELVDLFGILNGSLAAVYYGRGRNERAIEHYRRALELTPESAGTWNSLGTCYISQRMPEKAVEAIRKAIEVDPQSPEAHANLGNAWALMERWPRAIGEFKKAIELRPSYVEAYNNLGFTLYRSGSPEQALAAFAAAAELRPDYAEAHFNMGNIHLEQRRYDEAIACYREATRLQPNFAQGHYNLGQAWYGKGKLDNAIQSYRKAITINPKHYGAWHNLGIAYRDKGLKDKAVEALEKAVMLNPNLMR